MKNLSQELLTFIYCECLTALPNVCKRKFALKLATKEEKIVYTHFATRIDVKWHYIIPFLEFKIMGVTKSLIHCPTNVPSEI